MERGIVELVSGEQVECNIEISDGHINIHFPEDVDTSRWVLSAVISNDIQTPLVNMQVFNDKLKGLVQTLEKKPKICIATEVSAADLRDIVVHDIENVVGKGGVYKVMTYGYVPSSINEIKADMINANFSCNILCLIKGDRTKCTLDCCLL